MKKNNDQNNNRILLDGFCSVVGIGTLKVVRNPVLNEDLEPRRVENSSYILFSIPLGKAVNHLLKRTNWTEEDIKDRLLREDLAAREKFFLVGREL